MRAALVLFVPFGLAVAGCSARSGGALPHARPLAEPPAARGDPASAPSRGDGGIEALSRAPFFGGLEHLAQRLPELARAAAPPGVDPDVVEIPSTVRAAGNRFLAAGRRRPRVLLALGFSARLSRTPAACAEVLVDPEVLRRTLDADEVRSVAGTLAGGGRSRTYSVALLNRGSGPFRYDFRWTFRTRRVDLPSGAVLLRYEMTAVPAPERVSAFQGVLVLEPVAGGTRLSEVLVLGTDISLPFFLMGQAGGAVEKILTIRAVRLARLLR